MKVPTEKLVKFNPDLSPLTPQNKEAATQRGVEYDPDKNAYVDSDGCPIYDQFGQEL